MAKQIITDEEAALKRQARRRLLGAIALTILVVTLLPMVLDSEPPAPVEDTDLHIPDKDKAGEFVPKMVLPPSDGKEALMESASAPVITPLLDARTAAANTKPADTPAAAGKPEPLAKPPVAEMQPKAESKPQTEAKPQTAAKPRPESAPETKPKTEAKPAAKPANKTASRQHDGFVLQVGAFANADTAKKLQEKLHKLGYPSYTEKAGSVIRVRIGDYATQTEADKVRHKLEIQGYQPNVINLK